MFFETWPDRTLANVYGGTEMMDNITFLWKSLDEFKESMSTTNKVKVMLECSNKCFLAICD